jgi:hypothetical protein
MQFASPAVAGSLHDGAYHPNAPGATSLHDARPLRIGEQRVSVLVRDGGRNVTLFAGADMLFEGPTPAGVDTRVGLYAWIAGHPVIVRASRITYLPPTPVWNTLAPKAKNRNHGKGQAGITNRKRRRS